MNRRTFVAGLSSMSALVAGGCLANTESDDDQAETPIQLVEHGLFKREDLSPEGDWEIGVDGQLKNTGSETVQLAIVSVDFLADDGTAFVFS